MSVWEWCRWLLSIPSSIQPALNLPVLPPSQWWSAFGGCRSVVIHLWWQGRCPCYIVISIYGPEADGVAFNMLCVLVWGVFVHPSFLLRPYIRVVRVRCGIRRPLLSVVASVTRTNRRTHPTCSMYLFPLVIFALNPDRLSSPPPQTSILGLKYTYGHVPGGSTMFQSFCRCFHVPGLAVIFRP